MSVAVVVAPEALQQVAEFDSWWRTNRKAAADQVIDEYERILALLSERPEVGVMHPDRPDVRWIRLKKTPYKLYYRYSPGEDVRVVTVWSGKIKEPPPL